jgi:hypothetical protein
MAACERGTRRKERNRMKGRGGGGFEKGWFGCVGWVGWLVGWRVGVFQVFERPTRTGWGRRMRGKRVSSVDGTLSHHTTQHTHNTQHTHLPPTHPPNPTYTHTHHQNTRTGNCSRGTCSPTPPPPPPPEAAAAAAASRRGSRSCTMSASTVPYTASSCCVCGCGCVIGWLVALRSVVCVFFL